MSDDIKIGDAVEVKEKKSSKSPWSSTYPIGSQVEYRIKGKSIGAHYIKNMRSNHDTKWKYLGTIEKHLWERIE